MKGLAKDLGRIVSRERVKSAPEDLFAYRGDATYHEIVHPVELLAITYEGG